MLFADLRRIDGDLPYITLSVEMKNKTARALAIIALVFMGIFSGALIATLVDSSLMNGGIGYLALSSGVFSLMVFFALRADGKIVSNKKTVEIPQDGGADDKQGETNPDNASVQGETKQENSEANGAETVADNGDRADEEIFVKDENNG